MLRVHPSRSHLPWECYSSSLEHLSATSPLPFITLIIFRVLPDVTLSRKHPWPPKLSKKRLWVDFSPLATVPHILIHVFWLASPAPSDERCMAARTGCPVPCQSTFLAWSPFLLVPGSQCELSRHLPGVGDKSAGTQSVDLMFSSTIGWLPLTTIN